MADSIAILTSRPARVVAVVNVNLPRPRNRLSQDLTKLVDLIYEHVS